jgi:hypothetical protein
MSNIDPSFISISPNGTIDPSFNSYCSERKARMTYRTTPGLLFNLNRFDLRSPYDMSGGGYTKFQLDMRRKAEILQYKGSGGNSGGSKKNSLTKKQKWAQVVRNPYTPITPTIETPDCGMVVTPSQSSGIPGPNIPLYLDPLIPLYNYQNSIITNSYGGLYTNQNL